MNWQRPYVTIRAEAMPAPGAEWPARANLIVWDQLAVGDCEIWYRLFSDSFAGPPPFAILVADTFVVRDDFLSCLPPSRHPLVTFGLSAEARAGIGDIPEGIGTSLVVPTAERWYIWHGLATEDAWDEVETTVRDISY